MATHPSPPARLAFGPFEVNAEAEELLPVEGLLRDRIGEVETERPERRLITDAESDGAAQFSKVHPADALKHVAGVEEADDAQTTSDRDAEFARRLGFLEVDVSNGKVTTDNVDEDNGRRITDGTHGRPARFPYIGRPNTPPSGPNP